jgi:hypothetical protein
MCDSTSTNVPSLEILGRLEHKRKCVLLPLKKGLFPIMARCPSVVEASKRLRRDVRL